MTKLLSIIILTLPERKHFLDRVVTELNHQIMKSGRHEEIEICVVEGDSKIGAKRNTGLSVSLGKYIANVDDDDMVGPFYIKTLLDGIFLDVDCVSLRGMYYVDGVVDGIFEHSIKYKAWKNDCDDVIKYERYPNHLNCIRASIAKQFKFPDKNFGEDHDWSTQIHKSGLIKTEHYTQEILYHYYYVSGK